MEMRKINRKRLNNKGFTLIELLAVVVILAIVMGIAATSVLTSINNSRNSTLLSTAQNAANQLNTWAAEDALATTTTTMHIGTGSEFFKAVADSDSAGTWVCLSDDLTITNGGNPVSVLTALGLKGAADGSTGDIVVGGTVPTLTNGAYTIDRASNCSAVRYNKSIGGYEILLVANNQGKYYVANDGDTKNYAFSRASGYATSISD